MAPISVTLEQRLADLELAVFGGPNPANIQPPAVITASVFVGVDQEPATKHVGAGAVAPTEGLAVLNTGAASAMTLVAPLPGAQAAGGQDGLILTIQAIDAFAYTVTTPGNAVNGNKHILTWTAAIGNSIILQAYNGVWYTSATERGVTIT